MKEREVYHFRSTYLGFSLTDTALILLERCPWFLFHYYTKTIPSFLLSIFQISLFLYSTQYYSDTVRQSYTDTTDIHYDVSSVSMSRSSWIMDNGSSHSVGERRHKKRKRKYKKYSQARSFFWVWTPPSHTKIPCS